MNRIFEISARLVSKLETKHSRYLYDRIAWEDRLIMIRGARGVGKTTIMLQRIKESRNAEENLYASLDNIWFNDHTISELVDYHYKHGGRRIFLDEVHRYPGSNWEQELKNIIDSYPDYGIVFTGSSLLELNSKIADLSRRVAIYDLQGLSFREYLLFKNDLHFESISLGHILSAHTTHAPAISSRCTVIREFEQYLQKGFYPFFLSSSALTYSQRVERIVLAVIDLDIPAVTPIEYETLQKLKKLLVVLAEQVPFVPNMTKLSKDIGVTRNQLIKLFGLLDSADILRTLSDPSLQPKSAAKPAKILFNNPSVMQALGSAHHIGSIRESFLASMLSSAGRVFASPDGDFLLDRKYIFEVGGKGKGFSQIANKPDSFVVADDIEVGSGNKIPLWLFGFLY